jgi:urease accessory protein
VLARRQRHGPLAVQRPFYPEGDVCHVYLLHPPGGVVGGDCLQVDCDLEGGSHALVTVPGAAKFYRSAGAQAQLNQTLQVADGACLEWLPQENIFFPGAKVAMQTQIELSGDARLAWWETHCLGRPVIDESFDAGSLDAALQIRRDGRPLLIERLRIDSRTRLRSAMLAGRPVVASAVFSHTDSEQLRQIQASLAAEADVVGATLVDDLLLLRYLGDSTEQARTLFVAVWRQLREPLTGKPASTPRIWNT